MRQLLGRLLAAGRGAARRLAARSRNTLTTRSGVPFITR